ncbi:hypothetical protein [Cryobacterium sp. PH31-L1]|uniref:hypothetical protein n=1 Tax=Cryobacterium sp. PH31-L1 TaxID=3046199 RepID=UPI0024B9E644|nr:hypothetical protein [Cryobacterium sp. PH31-L1]MDJ0378259.1 hypothetical protein [Cryobacterium sp. PH31-L1]
MTAVDRFQTGPRPTLLASATSKVYAVPFFSPVTTADCTRPTTSLVVVETRLADELGRAIA